MRSPRPTKKKPIKKKTAVDAPSETTEAPTDGNEFDEWAEQQKGRTGCVCCWNSPIRETIRALLQSMERKRAYKITTQEIRRMIGKRHPDSTIGQRSLERHLLTCERDLYFRARGRKNA